MSNEQLNLVWDIMIEKVTIRWIRYMKNITTVAQSSSFILSFHAWLWRASPKYKWAWEV